MGERMQILKIIIVIALCVGIAFFTSIILCVALSHRRMKKDDDEQMAYLKQWSEKHKRKENKNE